MTEKDQFEKALHSWLLIDLPALQKGLDTQGVEIQEFQKESLVSRKELATRTKLFKKLESTEKLDAINPLLKQYQNEIDSLTKKNKSVESIFFTIYRAIADAPDPKPLLESALVSVQSSSELDLLRNEIQQLKDKLVQYADYDQLKKQLQTLSTQVEQKVANKLEEMQILIDSKENAWKEKEMRYEDIIEKNKKEIEELKIAQQVMDMKLNNRSDIFDESDLNSKATNIVELEMIQRSAEMSKLRVLQLEKLNELLTKEISQLQNKDNLKSKIDELTAQNMKNLAKLDQDQSIINDMKRQAAQQLTSTQVEIKQLKNEIEALKLTVAKTSDYDELKKELDVLKEIEFGGLDIDAPTTAGGSNNLDSIIMQTNRKLNNEVVEYRAKNDEISAKLAQLEADNLKLTEDLKKLESQNKSLEDDLSNMNGAGTGSANGWDTMSMISSISKTPTKAGRISPAASIAGSLTESTFGADSSSSILPIITQQRDRFRNRNKELEDEAKKQFTKVMELKREVATLKNDNKELYEKIRYLSSYSSVNQQEKRRSTNAPELKYETEYERELHPIEQFRLKESQRISSKIGPIERIYISVIRLILSSQLTRYLFAAYCCGLHCVIIILFSYTTNLHMYVTLDVTEGSTGGIAGSADTIKGFNP